MCLPLPLCRTPSFHLPTPTSHGSIHGRTEASPTPSFSRGQTEARSCLLSFPFVPGANGQFVFLLKLPVVLSIMKAIVVASITEDQIAALRWRNRRLNLSLPSAGPGSSTCIKDPLQTDHRSAQCDTTLQVNYKWNKL